MEILKKAIERTEKDTEKLQSDVSVIINRVKNQGDKALKDYNVQFDGCLRFNFQVTREEIDAAYEATDESIIADIKKAAANIEAFAYQQRRSMNEVKDFEVIPGAKLGHKIIPIESACCYVPGGGYPLFSTALMLAIPAKVAGVQRICACSPVIKGTETIHPLTLVAMDIAGVDEIYAVGGAHAIAAFAYGTDQIEPVDIIVGPGNSFVTEAKRQCYGTVGIDFVAGPSEVLIISDGTGDPEIAAADIIAQSEHSPDAKGILVTTSKDFGMATIAAVERQLDELETAEIAKQSWIDHGEVILVEGLDEAVVYANKYAPEHLEVCVSPTLEDDIVARMSNFGSLFIGQNTAEVFGDYASGTNHTLPTLGAARYTGGVSVATFMKICTYQKFTKPAMLQLAPLVSELASGEGLAGHANAADIRIKKA